MSGMQRWYQTAEGRRAAAQWWAMGTLGELGAARARQLCRATDGVAWQAFWRHLLGWLGVVLLAAAVVCLVAANWHGLSQWSKLGGLQGLLVLAIAVALWPQATPRIQTLALMLASVLLGALLALVGQIYQTGADPWQLFAAWALLMLPWALAGRSLALWLLWLGVIEVVWVLWADTSASRASGMAGFVLINLLALALYEIARPRYAWLRRAVGARLVAAVLLAAAGGWAALSAPGLAADDSKALGWWLGAAVVSGVYYHSARRDLAILAMALGSAIAVAAARGWSWLSAMGLEDTFALTGVALLVLVAGTSAAAWLRRLAALPASGGITP